jgi:DNA ligase-1
MSRFGTEAGPVPVAEAQLTAFFFDCLHLDGVDLIDEPLHRRMHALVAVVGDRRIPAVITTEPATGNPSWTRRWPLATRG